MLSLLLAHADMPGGDSLAAQDVPYKVVREGMRPAFPSATPVAFRCVWVWESAAYFPCCCAGAGLALQARNGVSGQSYFLSAFTASCNSRLSSHLMYALTRYPRAYAAMCVFLQDAGSGLLVTRPCAPPLRRHAGGLTAAAHGQRGARVR